MMNVEQLTHYPEVPFPVSAELTFLRQQTGQDETTILIQALHLGLNALYRETIEQVFIDGELSREKAVEMLGAQRVAELEYAQHALAQDIAQGLNL